MSREGSNGAPGDDPKPWRVLDSRMIHADRWVRLRADDCVTPSGVAIAPFYVMEYRDWIHAVAVTADGMVVLIRQYRHGVGAVTRELPGGVMDEGESDPVAAARRELLEEAGYDGEARYLGAHAVNPATHSNRIHTVLFTQARRTEAPAADPTEDIRVDLVPLESLRGSGAGRRLDSVIHIASMSLAVAALDAEA